MAKKKNELKHDNYNLETDSDSFELYCYLSNLTDYQGDDSLKKNCSTVKFDNHIQHSDD